MSKEKLQFNKVLLGKYLSGELCSAEELNEIKQYFLSTQYAPEIKEIMENDWTYLKGQSLSERAPDKQYDRLLNEKIIPYRQGRQRVVRMLKRGMQYAAVLLLLVGAVKIWRHQSATAITLSGKDVSWVENSTPRGKYSRITMPDGTRVYLGPESRISYRADYGKNSRLMRLQGEAFFEVIHNDQRPFIVEAEGIRTVDVGTAFNINAYPGGEQMKVSVKEGAVNILRANDVSMDSLVQLQPQESFILSKNNQHWIHVTKEGEVPGNWRNGEFHFKNEKLEKVLAVLSRHYNWQCNWENSQLKNKKITIHFVNDDQATALYLLAMTGGITIRDINGTKQISNKVSRVPVN